MNCIFESKGNVHTCKNCGFSIEINQSSDKIFRLCSQDLESQEPGIIQKAFSLAGAVIEHAINGMSTLNDEEYKGRMDICQGTETSPKCEFYNNGICRACGCGLQTKARWRSSLCPKGKWPI